TKTDDPSEENTRMVTSMTKEASNGRLQWQELQTKTNSHLDLGLSYSDVELLNSESEEPSKKLPRLLAEGYRPHDTNPLFFTKEAPSKKRGS
ncbi:11569_t:CDS:2, partial [Racocetra persica]